MHMRMFKHLWPTLKHLEAVSLSYLYSNVKYHSFAESLDICFRKLSWTYASMPAIPRITDTWTWPSKDDRILHSIHITTESILLKKKQKLQLYILLHKSWQIRKKWCNERSLIWPDQTLEAQINSHYRHTVKSVLKKLGL